MGKVTSKMQVTVPKAVADRVGIKPGDDLAWEVVGRVIHVIPDGAAPRLSREERVTAFAEMIERQRVRERRGGPARRAKDRGWRREDLYVRGQPR